MLDGKAVSSLSLAHHVVDLYISTLLLFSVGELQHLASTKFIRSNRREREQILFLLLTFLLPPSRVCLSFWFISKRYPQGDLDVSLENA
jgi:hypothetical protein